MKILLIDDEEQAQFVELAEDLGIEILHDPNRPIDQSLDELRRRFWEIDGVVVDGILDPDQRFQGLARSLGRIQELNAANHWWKPLCIWTGYANDVKNVVDQEIKVFEKAQGGLPVLEYLKVIIENLPGYKVKLKFKDALNACEFAGLTDDSKNHINAILRNILGNSTIDPDYPKHLRACLESMFRSAHSLGLVHEKCIDDRDQVNLTACSKFLSGQRVELLGVQCATRHAPDLVEQHIRHILNVTNAFSHVEGESTPQNKVQLNAYRTLINTPYLLYSLTFELLDVLIWYKAYAEAHSNAEENRQLWTDDADEANNRQMITGEVKFIHKDGYGFFRSNIDQSTAFIPQKLVSANKLQQGERIEVNTRPGDKGPVVTNLNIII